MFNNHKDPEDPMPPPEEEFMLPPLAAVTVTRIDNVEEVWEGHQIEQTTVGGLNIHRVYQVGETKFMQKLVVGYAPGRWVQVRQKIDIVEHSSSKVVLH